MRQTVFCVVSVIHGVRMVRQISIHHILVSGSFVSGSELFQGYRNKIAMCDKNILSFAIRAIHRAKLIRIYFELGAN